MTSLINLGILYLLALLTLAPFTQQPDTLLLVLAGLLIVGFHLVQLKPWQTVLSSAVIFWAAGAWPPLLPFTIPLIYTLSLDLAALPQAIQEQEHVYGGEEELQRLLRYRVLLLLLLPLVPALLVLQRLAGQRTLLASIYLLILWGQAIWLAQLSVRQLQNRQAAERLRDDLRALRHAENLRQEALVVEQEQAAERAKLEERERIAREMHDSVGHVLTSSLLQTAALSALNQDEALDAPLQELKQTLDEGMTKTRVHLHALEEQATDLELELEALAEGFRYCPLELSVRLAQPPPAALSQQMIASVREALTNVSKHSEADRVWVELREFPGFYRLVVRDNGRGAPDELLERLNAGYPVEGMGLRSLRQRTLDAGGHFAAANDGGLKVFMTFTREGGQR